MIDLIFLSWNRYEFTRAALTHLISSTEWELVDRLFLYDDGSTDGTAELIRQFEQGPAGYIKSRGVSEVIAHYDEIGGPVAIMAHFLAHYQPAAMFAKIDSDVIVPDGWLGVCARVMAAYPDIDLLGIEAGFSGAAIPAGVGPQSELMVPGMVRGYQEAAHIGGIGLMRSRFFRGRQLAPEGDRGRFGFTDFQNKGRGMKAWLKPPLPVVLLDRMPVDPWRSLSREYVAKGWQRTWPPYDETVADIWSWFEDGPLAESNRT